MKIMKWPSRDLFEEGWHNLKLYFMIGLPTEQNEDIEAITGMALKALKTAKKVYQKVRQYQHRCLSFYSQGAHPVSMVRSTPS